MVIYRNKLFLKWSFTELNGHIKFYKETNVFIVVIYENIWSHKIFKIKIVSAHKILKMSTKNKKKLPKSN